MYLMPMNPIQMVGKIFNFLFLIMVVYYCGVEFSPSLQNHEQNTLSFEKSLFIVCKITKECERMGERGGSVVERRTPDLPPPFCVLERDTLLAENTGNTQEAVAPSRLD